MKTVRKANRVLRIDDKDVGLYLKEGYDIIDESGKVIQESQTKTYSAAEVAEMRATYDARIAELEKRLKKDAPKGKEPSAAEDVSAKT